MTQPFLRIPPFPGRRAPPLRPLPGAAGGGLAAALRAEQVGGCFWGAQPDPGAGWDAVLAPADRRQLAAMLAQVDAGRVAVTAPARWPLPRGVIRLPALCDPWWLARHARAVWAGADHELALVAAIAGRAPRLFGTGRHAACTADPDGAAAAAVGAASFADPVSGAPCPAAEVIARLGEWRRLIDANRAAAAVFGVARWKRVTLDPLLWDGGGPVRHARRFPAGLARGAQVIAWKSRVRPALLHRLETAGLAIGELEDGMIRSAGLGANCVPPLSAIVDLAGVYFDPAGPSDLENLLETAEISPALAARAATLRERLVSAAIGKYGRADPALASGWRAGGKPGQRRVLVTGQVEDDRSVLSGGGNCSNLEAIARARALDAGAWIIYKPHPDVEAGHRKGHVPDAEALRFADEIVRDVPVTALIAAVDAVHVITSLAGFEALLRGKPVTTHGVPFYAGWGLTDDRGPIPPRRTRRRSLDELVAAALLLYPRYVDPVTRLPCRAEEVVMRLAEGTARVSSPLIALREWQGRLRLLWQRLTGRR